MQSQHSQNEHQVNAAHYIDMDAAKVRRMNPHPRKCLNHFYKCERLRWLSIGIGCAILKEHVNAERAFSAAAEYTKLANEVGEL